MYSSYSKISLAANTGRFTRDAYADAFESGLDLMKHLAQASGPLVMEVLKEVPTTSAYAKYREEMKKYLEAYEEYVNVEGLCVKKSVELLEKFEDMMKKYEAEDAPAEAKKINEIFNSFDSDILKAEAGVFFLNLVAAEATDSDEVNEDMEKFQILLKSMEIC